MARVEEAPEEKWRKIAGFDNYEVSSEGRVRNVKTMRFLKQFPNDNGYLGVILYRNGKSNMRRVHKLVASEFIGESEGRQVDHRDRNKLNNHVDNLRYVPERENKQNIASSHGVIFEYLDELPEDADTITQYGGHDFEDLYYSHERKEFYFYNGHQFRKLTQGLSSGSYQVSVWDTHRKRRKISLSKFQRLGGYLHG
jgi:hypothetical protein